MDSIPCKEKENMETTLTYYNPGYGEYEMHFVIRRFAVVLASC